MCSKNKIIHYYKTPGDGCRWLRVLFRPITKQNICKKF